MLMYNITKYGFLSQQFFSERPKLTLTLALDIVYSLFVGYGNKHNTWNYFVVGGFGGITG